MTFRSIAALAIVASTICGASAANAQSNPVEGNAAAGRELALLACTGCHVVDRDQPFKPIYVGSPHPPAFKDIASQPDVTSASLQRYLEPITADTGKTHVPNLALTTPEIMNLAAFIISLRDKAGPPDGSAKSAP
jgi:mono/diheme cytochrome c family protein